jgi:hypothetical protein
MRTVVERVDDRTAAGHMPLHPFVQSLKLRDRQKALRNAALISDDNNAKPTTPEQRNTVRGTGEKLDIFPPRRVASVVRFAIDDSVAIQEYSLIH